MYESTKEDMKKAELGSLEGKEGTVTGVKMQKYLISSAGKLQNNLCLRDFHRTLHRAPSSLWGCVSLGVSVSVSAKEMERDGKGE